MAILQGISPQRLANGLGWFSIGLGLAELVAPDTVAELIGTRGNGTQRKIVRLYGARELAAGIGILSSANRSGWLWARVAGDAVDLASLCKALASEDNDRGRTVFATASVTAVTVADIWCAKQLSRRDDGAYTRVSKSAVASSIIVGRPPNEVYSFWRDFMRLPEIFDRLESVHILDDKRSRWKLALPGERTLEWDAEITADQPGSRIAWHSASSSAPHSGEVRFEPATGNRGTRVKLEIRPKGLASHFGKLGRIVPEQHVKIALHNLKQLLETGEVAKSDASIHRGMHPARPPHEYFGGGRAVRTDASI